MSPGATLVVSIDEYRMMDRAVSQLAGIRGYLSVEVTAADDPIKIIEEVRKMAAQNTEGR